MSVSYPLYLGCTAAQHRMIGIDAVVNAYAKAIKAWRRWEVKFAKMVEKNSRPYENRVAA